MKTKDLKRKVTLKTRDNNFNMIDKKITRGGNKQLLVYLPKRLFRVGEVITIIKKSDILNKRIVIEVKKEQ